MLECAGTIVIKTIRWKFRTRYRRVDEGGKKWNCKKGKHYHVFSLLQILGSLLLQIQKKQNHERYRKISSLLSSNFKKIHLEETRKISRRESKKNERKEKERKRKGKQKKKKINPSIPPHPFFPRKKKRRKHRSIRHAQPCPASKSSRHFERKTPVVSLEIDHRFRSRFSPLSPRFPFPRPAPRESTSRLPLPTPLQLDSPTSYSRPAESGSRLIIRRVRLDSTDINEERASERDGDTDRGKKEGGHRSEERIEERRVEGSVQTGDTGISK